MPQPFDYTVPQVNALGAYKAGQQMRQQEDKQNALQQYLPGALQGNQADIGALGGAGHTDLLAPLLANVRQMDERGRAEAANDATAISTVFQGLDWTKATPQEIESRTQAVVPALSEKARAAFLGLPPDQRRSAVERASLMPAAIAAANERRQEDDRHQAARHAIQSSDRSFAETTRHNRATEAAAAAAAGRSAAAKSPEQRKALAIQYGIDPNSDEGRSFILTGDLPRQGRQTLTATDKEAILAADDKTLATTQGIDMLKRARALSDKSWQGWGSNSMSQVESVLSPFQERRNLSNNTIEFDNLLQSQVLPQLKAIFGGAPTEGERAILLALQGSSSISQVSRNRIIDRAIGLAESRLKSYEGRASELRGGTFYNPRATESGGYTPQDNPPPPSKLKVGEHTEFSNGQVWTIRNGKPVRIK
jgi:hypothetical protein